MKELDLNETGPRREFIRAAARYAALGALAVVATVLARRRASICTSPGPCRGCTAFATCGLPQAEATRCSVRGG